MKVQTRLENYIQQYKPDDYNSKKLASIVAAIKKAISSKKSLRAKNDFLATLSPIISNAKTSNDPNQVAGVEVFKAAISVHQNWKDALLNIPSVIDAESLKTHGTELTFNISNPPTLTAIPTQLQSIMLNDGHSSYKAMAQSIGTSNQVGLTSRMITDATFTHYTYDKQGKVTGLIMGIGSGVTTHQDPPHDKMASRTAYFGIKHLARLMETYSNPERLRKAFPRLLKLTEDAITQKVSAVAPAKFAVLRCFLQHDGQYRIVGVNLGNCAIGYYHPTTKKYTNICHALNYKDPHKALSFPEAIHSSVFETVDCTVPAEGILIGIGSDVVNLLADSTITTDPKSKKYVTGTSFKPSVMTTIFNGCNNEHECLNRFTAKIEDVIGLKKEEKNENQDYTVAYAPLPAKISRAPKKTWGKRMAYGFVMLAAIVLGAAVIATGVALAATGVFSPLGFLVGLFGTTIALTANQLLIANIALCIAVGITTLLTTAIAGISAIYCSSKIWRDFHKYDAIPVIHHIPSTDSVDIEFDDLSQNTTMTPPDSPRTHTSTDSLSDINEDDLANTYEPENQEDEVNSDTASLLNS